MEILVWLAVLVVVVAAVVCVIGCYRWEVRTRQRLEEIRGLVVPREAAVREAEISAAVRVPHVPRVVPTVAVVLMDADECREVGRVTVQARRRLREMTVGGVVYRQARELSDGSMVYRQVT